MTEYYFFLLIFALLVLIIGMGVWLYRGDFTKPAGPPKEIFPEVPPPPPKVEVVDRDRRARVARMSSVGGDGRRR